MLRNVLLILAAGLSLLPFCGCKSRPQAKWKIAAVIRDCGRDEPGLYAKSVGTDNYNGGKLAAEHLLASLAKQGKTAPKLALFRYQPGSESTEQREKGFLDRVKAEAESRDGK